MVAVFILFGAGVRTWLELLIWGIKTLPNWHIQKQTTQSRNVANEMRDYPKDNIPYC